MKERIMTGWNIQRIVLLVTGLAFITYSLSTGTWTGIFLGLYFAAMGVFRLGCAAGSCYGNACGDQSSQTPNKTKLEVQFEEVDSR